MNISNPQYIREYLYKKFKDNYVLSSDGSELICPSIFLDSDHKRHMSINTETGLWQCFKTGEKGNFVSLYAKIEGIKYFDALVRITTNNLEYISFEEPKQQETQRVCEYSFDTEKYSYIRYDEASSDDIETVRAWGYLNSRELFDRSIPDRFTYYYGRSGKYSGRIIIPYTYANISFFFQARSVDGSKPKYLIPKNSNAAYILYPFDEGQDYVVLCEGILDAISLQIQGINATASTGASVTPGQMEILRSFGGRIIVGFDNDNAGQEGLRRLDKLRKDMRMDPIYYINPPIGKDWNEAHVKGEDLNRYILNGFQEYNNLKLIISSL